MEGAAVPPGAVIELDASPSWQPLERPAPRRPWQRLLAAVVVLVAVFGLGAASQRPTAPGAAFTVDGSGLVNMLADDRAVYLLRQVNLDTSIVAAYRTSDGQPVWSHRMGRVDRLVDVGRGVLLLHVPASGSTGPDASVAVALDTGDGHERWRRSEFWPTFFDTATTGVLVVEPLRPAAATDGNKPAQPSRLEALDVRTGSTVWSSDISAGAIRSYLTPHVGTPGDEYRVGALEPDGTLRLIDAQTGRVTRTTRLPNPDPLQIFDVSGDLMTAFAFGSVGPSSIKVFDLVAGRLLWARSMPEDGDVLAWCGAVLCGYDGIRTVVIEPRTGRELWHTVPGARGLTLDGKHLITVRGAPPASGRWPISVVVNDLRSGAVLRDLGTWQVIDIRTWPKLIVLGRDGTQGAVVGLMDATTGHTVVFGRLGRLYSTPSCAVFGKLFMCQAGTSVSAFRIPT